LKPLAGDHPRGSAGQAAAFPRFFRGFERFQEVAGRKISHRPSPRVEFVNCDLRLSRYPRPRAGRCVAPTPATADPRHVRRFHSHFVGFQGFAARKSFPSASGGAEFGAGNSRHGPAMRRAAIFPREAKTAASRSHRSGRVEGLDMGGFQRGQERTLPRIGIFRNKKVAILKARRRARVAGGRNPWNWRPNHRAAVGESGRLGAKRRSSGVISAHTEQASRRRQSEHRDHPARGPPRRGSAGSAQLAATARDS
jgi:hypothetical protein